MVSGNFLKAYRFLCYEVLFLIAFGGSVRAMDAGLACPDWPLCFGDYIPDFHIQVYFEFLHRVLAGTVGLFVGGFGIYLLARKDVSVLVKSLSVLSIVLVLAQVVMGGLTVLLLLDENTVTGHLLLATMLFASLLWTYWELRAEQVVAPKIGIPGWLKGMILTLLFAVWAQIILGGLVSANYAGMACPTFPLCHGRLVPTLQGLVGLQVMHRLGAYLCVALAFAIWIVLRKPQFSRNVPMRSWSRRLILAVIAQIFLGIANVVFVIPPLITVLHLAVATYILGASLRLTFLMYWDKGELAQTVRSSERQSVGWARPVEKNQ
ncbi:MAG: COX15/CtaA family protein [Bdellovibrionaceae bacterium]|nr:COX15/CtaA family protein [Bdellovibrionales bacterium]MCB9086233.1 COX15/CtaA family protein [Pseudobdellovibrionaceae bacterium]